MPPRWVRILKHYLNLNLVYQYDDDDDDGILKVSRREHHCLMALALAAQLSTAVA
jgi:RNase P/RNase MRP subunit POP5